MQHNNLFHNGFEVLGIRTDNNPSQIAVSNTSFTHVYNILSNNLINIIFLNKYKQILLYI